VTNKRKSTYSDGVLTLLQRPYHFFYVSMSTDLQHLRMTSMAFGHGSQKQRNGREGILVNTGLVKCNLP